MADECDRAQTQIDQALAHSLSYRKPMLRPAGSCFYCGENLGRGLLFCSPDCAQDYEHEEKMRQIIGRTQGHG